MGEARQRGTFDERRKTAVKRNKDQLGGFFGGMDPIIERRLRAGIAPFLARLGSKKWEQRRAGIVTALRDIGEEGTTDLEKSRSIRVKEDEIAWYLFLAEQALSDPFCTDISQSQRSLAYFAGIGSRWQYVDRIRGIDDKLDEILYRYKSAPDGGIFELCVALAYASKGWDVELIPTRRGDGVKTADMVVRKDGAEVYVECKRQNRRADYVETERNEFLRLWDAVVPILVDNKQWIWLKGVFHVEISSLPTNFLAEILKENLPLTVGESKIYDGAEVTLHARQINYKKVQQHFLNYRVKSNSPTLSSVVGGSWAPKNSAVTMVKIIKSSKIVDCEVPILGTYIDQIAWACGFTREIDADVSIEKKARDIKNLLADAVKQVPNDRDSIIHIGAETLEGVNVEHRRSAKVMESIPNFVTDKPVVAVRFHRFQPNQAVDLLFEFDETIETFARDNTILNHIPTAVVIPEDVQMRDGTHWDLYPHG